jgi:hypothetical protein
MTADRDITRIVRSWLRTDEHDSADRVLQVVLARLDSTPQRRSWWPARRSNQMNNVMRIAVAAVAVIAVAVAGYNLIRGPGGVGGPRPSSTPTVSPAPTPAPTSAPALLNDQPSLGARYLVGSGLQNQVTVAAPADWSASGDWVVIGPKGNGAPDGMAIRIYYVGPDETIYKNPTSLAEGVVDPLGPTAAELAAAIVGAPAWHATGPTNATIGGRRALHVQFSVPTTAGLGPDGRFDMFGKLGEVQEWGFVLGQEFDVYMLDVAGERIVIDAFHYAGTSASDLAAQQAVLDSIQINPKP